MNLLICILGAMAAILAVFPDPMVIYVCSGIGTACAVWILLSLLSGKLQLKLTLILVLSLLVGYCYGTFSVETNAIRDGVSPLYFIGVDAQWVAYALVLVMVACICLVLGGRLESPLIREEEILEVSGIQERFLWLAVIVGAVGFMHGDLSLGGATAQAGTGRVTVIGEIANATLPIVAPIAAIGAVQSSKGRRLRFIFITVATMLLTLPLGRRMLTYTALLVVIAGARLSGRVWHVSMGRKILTGIIAVTVVSASSLVYYGLRLATWQMGDGHHSLIDVLSVAERTSFTNWRSVGQEEGENVQDRPAYLIMYLSLLGRGGHLASPMWGKDAELAVNMAIPDIVYRTFGFSKDSFRAASSEELLANEHYGISDLDDANSVLTGGLIDFGFAGIVLYPLIICALLRLYYLFLRRIFPPESIILGLLSIIFLCFQAEQGLADYTVTARNIAILLVGWTLLRWVPRISSRKYEMFPPSGIHAIEPEVGLEHV